MIVRRSQIDQSCNVEVLQTVNSRFSKVRLSTRSLAALSAAYNACALPVHTNFIEASSVTARSHRVKLFFKTERSRRNFVRLTAYCPSTSQGIRYPQTGLQQHHTLASSRCWMAKHDVKTTRMWNRAFTRNRLDENFYS
ncbi:hypothetical protein CY34DRAFT_561822 [Suillus luteus UH-Slu-Lm8-n1]|uniref:Uncharacterized protein n=1 Tax=Suillus luteus UH-Slu-Lm8-n1 TaxID=930992 RepID=A0A0D0AC73_9AGAM|nr:hypothetical protein CY34DRAFT_561822 [Suillus luteus UH-Slu-Lm8-n1]